MDADRSPSFTDQESGMPKFVMSGHRVYALVLEMRRLASLLHALHGLPPMRFRIQRQFKDALEQAFPFEHIDHWEVARDAIWGIPFEVRDNDPTLPPVELVMAMGGDR